MDVTIDQLEERNKEFYKIVSILVLLYRAEDNRLSVNGLATELSNITGVYVAVTSIQRVLNVAKEAGLVYEEVLAGGLYYHLSKEGEELALNCENLIDM